MSETTIRLLPPTPEMIEAGAKAAYGTIFRGDNWPDVSGSLPAEYYRRAAAACFVAMMGAWREAVDAASRTEGSLSNAREYRQRQIQSGRRTITLIDDGCRIWFTLEGSINIDPTERFLWAEYKHCDLPGPASEIADLLMEEPATPLAELMR